MATYTRERRDSVLSVEDTQILPVLVPTISSTTLVEDFPSIVDPSTEISFDNERLQQQPKPTITESLASLITSFYQNVHRKIFKNSKYHQRPQSDTA